MIKTVVGLHVSCLIFWTFLRGEYTCLSSKQRAMTERWMSIFKKKMMYNL